MRMTLRSYDLMVGRVRITFQRTLRIPDGGPEQPLGQGYTVEGQITEGGLELIVFEPKPGRFPARAPQPAWYRNGMCCRAESVEMGLGAGGRMRQKIYTDSYGLDTWDPDTSARVPVHIVNSEAFREITGIAPPPTPIGAESYMECGLPWFELWDQEKGDVAPSSQLAAVKTISQLGTAKGITIWEPPGGAGPVIWLKGK